MNKSEINIQITNKIKQLREKFGMTQREVEKAANLHYSALYYYEHNPKCSISALSLYRLSKAFNVPMEYFFKEEKPSKKKQEEIIEDYKEEEVIVDYEKETSYPVSILKEIKND
jgi:transcriptional regulator with XRE-family HTH domain